jgi:hypothetical protein
MKAKISIFLLVIVTLLITGCNKNFFVFLYNEFYGDPMLASDALSAPPQRDEISLDLCLNRQVFRAGDTLSYTLTVDGENNNIGGYDIDVYTYALFPNGWQMVFNTNRDILQAQLGFIDNPFSFGHFNKDLQQTFKATYNYNVTGNEPPGTYELGTFVTPNSALGDGKINPGNIYGKGNTSFYLDTGLRPETAGFNLNNLVFSYNYKWGDITIATEALFAKAKKRSVAINFCKNKNTFGEEDALIVQYDVMNISKKLTVNADYYLGVILPDNETVVTVDENFIGRVGRIDEPSSWRPLMVNYRLDQFDTHLHNIRYFWNGVEPEGDYELFGFATRTGVLDDNEVNAGDISGFSTSSFFVKFQTQF